jgi:hypothetical protein
MDYDIVAPDASGTIESLSALGYSLEAAVADLVDNSIDAGASRVDIEFHWAGMDSWVAVLDDGSGMDEAGLQEAMTLALKGPASARADRELGRFGMGLKTASFSQSRRLTVWSTVGDASRSASRSWDLDYVARTGEWRLARELASTEAESVQQLLAAKPGTRTIVIWSRLSRLVDRDTEIGDERAHRHFLDAVASTEWHLRMIFGRYLSGRTPGRTTPLHLAVNGSRVDPWDPFLRRHSATLPEPVEYLGVDGHQVVVSPYVLPPRRRLGNEEHREAGGPRGWLSQQGFYVFRNDRLIVAGGWLGLPKLRSDEKHVLARIAVDIPSSIDSRWSIDVKKATASPPAVLRGDLMRCAQATRAKAVAVASSVSRTTALQRGGELDYAWRPEKRDSALRLRLNWDHPLVRESLEQAGSGRSTVRALLRLLEETVPISALSLLHDAEGDTGYVPFSSTPTSVIEVAERLYGAFVSQGMSPDQARRRLIATPPFNEFPDLPAEMGIS